MKTKDTVYYYTIKIDFKDNKVHQEQKKYTVLGVNSNRLVINDEAFTSIKHTKLYRGDHDELFNKTRVFESSYSTYWDYIYAYLYSSSSSTKIAYKRMKKALEKFIYEKHGRYCNAITFLDRIEIK